MMAFLHKVYNGATIYLHKLFCSLTLEIANLFPVTRAMSMFTAQLQLHVTTAVVHGNRNRFFKVNLYSTVN